MRYSGGKEDMRIDRKIAFSHTDFIHTSVVWSNLGMAFGE